MTQVRRGKSTFAVLCILGLCVALKGAEAEKLLDQLYAPKAAWRELLAAPPDLTIANPWQDWTAARAKRTADAPLAGLRVMLDPGHLGGQWAEMEGRAWSVEDGVVVKEGELVLTIAKALEKRLSALGAIVELTRRDDTPATELRPIDFVLEAIERQRLRRDPVPLTLPPDDPAVQRLANRLFYRTAEIRARVPIVAAFAPDIVLCLHLNGASWPDPTHPSLVTEDHLHVLINGAFMAGELSIAEQQAQLFRRLSAGWHTVEAPVALALADALAESTNLPAFTYEGQNAAALSEELIPAEAAAWQEAKPFVWARNLLANRIFPAPVVFLEPYVLNSETAYRHLQMGRYTGTREVNGAPRKDLLTTYIDGVVQGLLAVAGPLEQ